MRCARAALSGALMKLTSAQTPSFPMFIAYPSF
jgi:hypothetical protein